MTSNPRSSANERLQEDPTDRNGRLIASEGGRHGGREVDVSSSALHLFSLRRSKRTENPQVRYVNNVDKMVSAPGVQARAGRGETQSTNIIEK